MDAIELGLGLNEPEAQDLLEVERNRAKDHTVRLWFIYTALNYGNSQLTDVARSNFDKAHAHFLSLYNVGGQSAAETELRETIQDRFHNEYAKEVFAL
jgi:hypothetical protein